MVRNSRLKKMKKESQERNFDATRWEVIPFDQVNKAKEMYHTFVLHQERLLMRDDDSADYSSNEMREELLAVFCMDPLCGELPLESFIKKDIPLSKLDLIEEQIVLYKQEQENMTPWELERYQELHTIYADFTGYDNVSELSQTT